jgi:hypothetical protein
VTRNPDAVTCHGLATGRRAKHMFAHHRPRWPRDLCLVLNGAVAPRRTELQPRGRDRAWLKLFAQNQIQLASENQART